MGSEAASGEMDIDGGAWRGLGRRFEDAGLVRDDGVAPVEDAEGAELFELGSGLFPGGAAAGEAGADGFEHRGVGGVHAAAIGGEAGANVEMAEAGLEGAAGSLAGVDGNPDTFADSVLLLVYEL